jgi:hypothetical protein
MPTTLYRHHDPVIEKKTAGDEGRECRPRSTCSPTTASRRTARQPQRAGCPATASSATPRRSARAAAGVGVPVKPRRLRPPRFGHGLRGPSGREAWRHPARAVVRPARAWRDTPGRSRCGAGDNLMVHARDGPHARPRRRDRPHAARARAARARRRTCLRPRWPRRRAWRRLLIAPCDPRPRVELRELGPADLGAPGCGLRGAGKAVPGNGSSKARSPSGGATIRAGAIVMG